MDAPEVVLVPDIVAPPRRMGQLWKGASDMGGL